MPPPSPDDVTFAVDVAWADEAADSTDNVGVLHGRFADRPNAACLKRTHALDCDDAVDVRDGLTRTAGSNALTYADGSKVVIGATFVVVWVERWRAGGGLRKRAYLVRHSQTWGVMTRLTCGRSK